MRHPSPRPKSLCFKTFRLAFAVLLAAGSAARAQERVHFPSDDADLTKGPATEIPAYLFKPLGAGPFPAVVGMHGCGGLFNAQGRIEARAIEWSAVLNARGYAVLYPESFAPRRASGGCVGGGPAVRPWNERPRDAYGALAYLQSLPFVIGDRIGLMGWSHGGGTVLFTIDRSSPARPAALPKGDFRAAVEADEKVLSYLSLEKIQKAFSLDRHLANVDRIFARVFGVQAS